MAPDRTGRSSATSSYMRRLRSLAIWLVDEGILAVNPFRRSRRRAALNPLLPVEESDRFETAQRQKRTSPIDSTIKPASARAPSSSLRSLSSLATWAVQNGFSPLVTIDALPSPEALEAPASLEAPAGPDIAGCDEALPLAACVRTMVEYLAGLDAGEIGRIAASLKADRPLAEPARASIVRAGAAGARRSAKAAVHEAFCALRARLGTGPELDCFESVAIDAAAALAVQPQLDPTTLADAIEPWVRATGQRFN